jgi:flagellar hook-associated protein 2
MTVSLPTLSTATAGVVTSQGIGSGIDISTLVTSLVNATITPQQTLLQNQQSTGQATISALGSVQSALSSLQTAVQAITTGSALTQLSAQSSNSLIFSASAGTGAVAGSYQVQVQTLAQANTIQSSAFDSASATVPTGTYSITAGGSTFNVSIDSSNDTLSGLAAAINNSNGGASATIVNGTSGSYLLLSATQTGLANAVSMSSSSPMSFTSVQSASDATGTIAGIAFDSPTNVVSNALSNVALTLTNTSAGATQTLTVSANVQSAATAVQSFVTAYNAALSLITTDTAYTPGSGTSSTTGTAGPLLGDLAVQSIQHQLQSIVGAGTSSGIYSQLSQIGVTTNSDGTLAIDSGTLSNALQQNPNAVQQLFSGSNGIGTNMLSMLNQAVGAGGSMATEIASLNTQSTAITAKLAQLTSQSTLLTAQYNAEFNAMDTVVQAYKNTASLLTQLYTPNTNTSNSSSS